MTRPLRIGFWNINGYNSSILGNKLGTNDFMDVINKHDIFAIVETHVMQRLIFAILNILLGVEINQENELLEAYLYM